MNILQVNKFHFPQGGADQHYLELCDLLRQAGHTVRNFAMAHPKNLPSPDSPYFAPFVDFSRPRSLGNLGRILTRLFGNPAAKQQLKRLLLARQPDLVHLHNIYHQLTPSILPVLKEFGLPIVMTVHDYNLLSPNYNLLPNRSWLTWLLSAVSFGWDRWRKIYERHLDAFIVPSDYARQKFLTHGWPKEKIFLLPHFVKTPAVVNQPPEQFLLYAGRLDWSKGADIIVRVAALLPNGWQLKIAGSGPAEAKLKELAARIEATGKITWLGQLSPSALEQVMAKAYLVLVPSRAPETFGLTAAQSLSLGVPVIAHSVGALPELVQDKINGYLLPYHPPEKVLVQAWAGLIQKVIDQPTDRQALAAAAAGSVAHLDIGNYLTGLERIYAEVLA